MVPFDFENDKILMVKIGIKKRTKKEIKVPKRKKSNKKAK